MRAAKNPPSFILVDKSTGEVVYTKRATGVGSEAISKCVERGNALARKTGRTYFVYLDIMGAKIGMKIAVSMAYALGITEEIGPRGSAMPSGRRCCSSPDARPSGQGTRCFNCQHWESDSYLRNPGRVRKNIYTFNNPPSGPADPTAARELELYIDNDADLYRQQFVPIVKNLMLKRRKGVYNRELAVKLFMYLMDSGAKKYLKEFGTGGNIDTMFNRNTRMAAARAFRDSFETEAELGNYDRMIGPVSNPRGRVRKNIYTFNNPKRQLNAMERAASLFNLYVTTWAPGDGMTRYRFHRQPADYHDGTGIYTAMGRADALKFLKSYGVGRSRMNPSRSARKFVSTEIGHLRRKGYEPKRAAAAAYSMARKAGYRVNACSNPLIRGDQLPHDLKQRVLASFIYRWTSDNYRREEVWRGISGKPRIPLITDAQWLREHAFHVTKDGRLDARHHHAEPGFMAKDVRPNPLLQTVLLANPPISAQWDRLSQRQRLEILGFVGFGETAGRYLRLPWRLLSSMVRQALEEYWLDSTASRGTTRRRMAPVGANPLTRHESANILKDARSDIEHARVFVHGPTRSAYAGRAIGRAQVVEQYSFPKTVKRTTTQRTIAKAVALGHGSVRSNPGVRLPKPGTRLTVAQALDLAERLGNRELVKQCHAAMKLQKAANRGAKCVIWKVFPMGSKTQIDSVVALTHYGDSPETMYKPPPGSKKGNHMYRHNWGEKGGKQSVPLLASPDGKMLMMPLEGRKVASDWLRH